MAAGGGPLLLVGGPPAAEGRGRPGVAVELDDVGDGPLEEGPVVGHHHERPRVAEHEPLEAVEAVEVEVVGRLVEQEDVGPGHQHARPGSTRAACPPDSVAVGLVEDGLGQPEVGQHLGQAHVVVGGADGHPPVEGGGVAVVGPGLAVGEGARWRPRRSAVRLGHAGAPGDLLPAVSCRRGAGSWASRVITASGGRARDRPGVGAEPAGQDRQQGRLADPVRTDQPGALAGRDRHVDAGEDRGGAAVEAQVSGGEGERGG